MLNLRAYQTQAVDELSYGFKEHLRQLFVLPTGGGKTVVFSEISNRAVKKSTETLILTDRTELFKQALKSVERLGIPVCKINPDTKTIYPDAKLYIGMVETVARRLEQLKTVDIKLIIIDEAHKGNFFKIIDAFPNARVIGATATPINKLLHKYYTSIVNVIEIPELIAQGFLMPCKPFQKQDDFSDLDDKKDEFKEDELFAHFNKSKLYEGVVEDYLAKCNGKKTIVFNVNIEHSEQMTKAFNAAGISSFNITSKTPTAERKYILEEFAKGSFLVLNNCGILTTGYDEPTIECVIVNRATKSLALWLQMGGRGARPCTEINKKYFLLLDFGMNHDRHGLWEEVRDWTLAPPKKKKAGVGACPVKVCVNCEAMISAMSAKCQFCGHEYEIGNLVLRAGTLMEVKPRIPVYLVDKHIADLSIEELIALQKTKVHSAQMIWRVVRSKGEDAIKEYAKLQAYSWGWIERQINDLNESLENGISLEFNNYKIKQVNGEVKI